MKGQGRINFSPVLANSSSRVQQPERSRWFVNVSQKALEETFLLVGIGSPARSGDELAERNRIR